MRLRKLVIYSLIFMMTLFMNNNVFALSGKVTGTDVRVRSGAGTSYQTLLEDAGYGNVYTVTDSNPFNTSDGSSGCGTGKWYKIAYGSQYVLNLFLIHNKCHLIFLCYNKSWIILLFHCIKFLNNIHLNYKILHNYFFLFPECFSFVRDSVLPFFNINKTKI